MRKIVAGNWKMNKDRDEAKALLSALAAEPPVNGVEVYVAPAFPFLAMALELAGDKGIRVAAQNCHHERSGAHTGEVSVPMLRSLGIDACIVGHSERRLDQGESDELIARKLELLLEFGISPILCVGETLEQREASVHFKVVTEQLTKALAKVDVAGIERLVIAYEPVWAIGTGVTASTAQAQEMHAYIRAWLSDHSANAADVPLLYGGSCKPGNAEDLFAAPDINGGLIGGASLVADQFVELIKIAGRS